MSSSNQNLDRLKIPLKDILVATNNFSSENFIKHGGFGKIYRGKLLRSGELIDIVARRLDTKYGQGSKQFWTEVSMLSSLKHRNLVSIVGFCDEKNEKIVINKYEAKGSLNNYLSDPSLTWLQRLRLCAGVARALNYIHYDVGRDFSIIHRNIKSSKILLDSNYEPKLAGFNLSMTNVASRRGRLCIEDACGSTGYVDPTYAKTGTFTQKSDIYSFGVVIFEVLFGKKAITDNRDIKLAQLAKSHYEKGQLDDLIDPDLRKQMDQESLNIFAETAYYCLKEQRAERPDINQIVVRLDKALNLQWELENLESADSTSSDLWKVDEDILSSSLQEFAHLQIPLEDIASATSNFADENLIGHGGFGKLYRGKLSRSGKLINIVTQRLDVTISGQGVVEFSMEISMLSILKHENVVSFLGFCDENGEKIIIYEHAVHGSLDQYLSDPALTWSQRLQICIGVARALNHIHYDVIHCNINSSQVLIDKDWEAKVYGFGLSTKYPESWSHRLLFSPYFDASGCTDAFMTPKYDVYSFGRILLEVFSRWEEITGDSGVNQSLAAMATRLHVEKKLDEHMDPNPREQIESQTLTMLSKITKKCLNQYMERPSMDKILKELEEVLELHESKHKDLEPPTNADEGTSLSQLKEEDIECLEIRLSDIRHATNNFDQAYLIGKGGYGEVYKADVGHLANFQGISTMAGRGTVAIKRIFNKEGQSKQEFFKEVNMLNSCKHQNIVSLLGISTEDPEMILVFEFASNGSLEDCLEKGKMINVTWAQRLSICLDIAKGLKYLHTEFPQKSRIFHRDVKSANVLLDEEWNAKISDFGLSKFNPAIQHASTMIFTQIAGTDVYIDPEYMKKGKYKIASDVYSFGIVLFEILSGTLAYNSVYKEGNDKGLGTVARRHFDEGTLKELIDPNMMREDNGLIFTLNRGPNQDSFEAFSKIAYKCVAETQDKRPTLETVIKELQNAISLQGKTLELMKFRLSNIVNATKNFSDKYCIGVGTYGKMYNAELDHFESKSMPYIEGKNEGRLPNRRINVALKRISNDIGHGKQGFFAEIGMLTRYKHPNIVSLLGISCEDREMILVYKDAYNGSLSDCLRHTEKVAHLSWEQRIQISLDIAHGLNYLLTRTKNKQMIMHFEMNSTNILLDADWKAKITCYWHSNLYLANQEASIHNTNSIGGTKVHMDPDYIQMGKLKSVPGTYSFGVILFEILSGRLENDDIYVVENERLTSVARRHFEEGTLTEIIDPNMMKKANESFSRPNQDSLAAFSKIAYQCLAETDQAKRPTMQVIIEELQNALQLQEEKNNLRISLADIKLATQDFSRDNLIGKGGFGQVYKGKLLSARGHKFIAAKRLEDRTSGQGETELMTELVILSEYQHMNVIDLLSYCDESGEKVLVYDYASRGSLDKWLKRKELTWRKRLEICIDIARGLDFLHGTNDVKEEVVIHRDIKSANILLYDDWKASIADFGLSSISPIYQDVNFAIDNVKGTPGYCDPQYITTGFLTKESDIYSFGVLLFEMLCGRFVMEHNSSRAQNLVHLVRHHVEEGTLYEMVFEATKKQMAAISSTIFQNIAYQCIHEDRSKRPTAYDVLIQLRKALKIQEKWEHLYIPLDDIMLATQHFSHDNLIGKGDFWSVYKGQVTCADGCEIIAAKRLDRRSDKGETERMAELEIPLEYTHENIISLVGCCNEKGEKIMVYEYASISKGSLDRWLKYDGLTWRKRLEICIDITRGLAFLHGTSHEKQEVVLHGDIKSTNVLLNGDWKAKIANFGQSLIRPIYMTTGFLTKEFDIYSLGVLLFEMLCGRSVMEHNSSRAQNFINFIRNHFKEGTLYEIVFEAIKKQMVPASLTAFQSIAYQCIHEEIEKRPTAEDVLIQLKKALEFQINMLEVMEMLKTKLPRDYERLIQMTDSREIMNKDLYAWLHKGILHRDHKVFFSFGANGGRVETISATEFQFKSYYRPNKWRTLSKSRFGEVVQISDSSSMNIQISVKTQLLSPGVNYGVYLVYKFCRPIDESTTRTHKLAIKMGSEDLFPEFTTRRDNEGWMRIELYRFWNLEEEANFDAFLLGFSDTFKNEAIYVEGVEFRPI